MRGDAEKVWLNSIKWMNKNYKIVGILFNSPISFEKKKKDGIIEDSKMLFRIKN